MEKDKIRFLRIAHAAWTGEPLSYEDVRFFNDFRSDPKFDSKTYDDLEARVNKDKIEGKSPNQADLDSLINGAADNMAKNPIYKDQMTTLAKQAAAGKVSRDTANIVNTMLAGTDIATSLNQINRGNQAAAQLRQPARPPVLAADQRLAQALGDAQQGTFAEPTAIAAARLGNVDALRADDAAARTASYGQAGAYSALHQAGVGRYNRANANLVPAADAIHAREQNRYDQLLGMKLGENQAINHSQAQTYGEDLYAYMANRQAANSLISTGQSNLRGAMTGLAQTIPNYAAMASNRRYEDVRNQHSTYGEPYQSIAADAHMNLDRQHGRYVPDQSAYEDSWIGDTIK